VSKNPGVTSCAYKTISHLPKEKIVELELPEEDQLLRPRVPWPNHIVRLAMPHQFVEKLDNICTHCDCKRDILWRNLHRADSHFEACFRYHDDKADPSTAAAPLNKCFLKRKYLRTERIMY
jgi:hypothetical protein